MLRKNHYGLIIILVVLGVLFSNAAMAELKIAYVNSQRILAILPSAIEAQKKLEEESNKWGLELQKMNEDLKTLQESLEQQSLLLSEEKKREKAEELQALYLQTQQFQATKWGEGGEFFKKREELIQPVYDEITKSIQKIGDAEEYDFIFDSVAGNLLHAKEKYDITDKVLKDLGVDPSK